MRTKIESFFMVLKNEFLQVELVASPTFAVAQSRTGKKVNPLNRISWVFHNLARRSFYFTEH